MIRKVAFVLAFLLACSWSMPAAEYGKSCPASRDGLLLGHVDVLDGAPRADGYNAYLEGVEHKSYTVWDVGNIYRQGRNVYLICQYSYGEKTESVTVQVKDPVKRCIVRNAPAGPTLVCQ